MTTPNELATTATEPPALRTASADAMVTRGGALQRITDVVELRASLKEIYTMDRGKTWTITAEGWRAINRVTGMQLVPLPSVSVDGRDRTNPCVIKDDKGRISEVYYRAALIGRAQSGNLIVLVQTMVFSPDHYFTRNLYNIVKLGVTWDNGNPIEHKEFGDAGRLAPIVYEGGRPQLRDGTLKPHEVIYPLDEYVGIVADLKSKKVNDVLAQKNEHQVHGVKMAQTFCERRLFSRHPGVPPSTIAGDHIASVEWSQPNQNGGPTYQSKLIEAVAHIPVMGWLDSAEEQALMMSIAAGVRSGKAVEGAQVIDDGDTPITPEAESDDEKLAEPGAPAAQKPIDVAAKTTPAPAPEAKPQPKPEAKEPAKDAKARSPRQQMIDRLSGLFRELRALPGGDSRANAILGKQLNDGEEVADLADERLERLRLTVESQISQARQPQQKGTK